MALGISVYPKHGNSEDIKKYVEKSAKLGYTKCFMCMLSIDDVKTDIKRIKETIDVLKDNEFYVLVDLSPSVFKQLGIEPTDLNYFKQLGVDGIRLDDPFDGRTESLLTFDSSGIDINLNISNDVSYLNLIMDYQADGRKISGSHNFYPLIGTGLSEEHFTKTTSRFKDYNIETAAFINGCSGKIGAEYSKYGLCTLEQHRNQDVSSQVNYFKATKAIDDIYFSTMYVSEEQLQEAANMYFKDDVIRVRVKRTENNSKQENEIIDMLHFYRGDVNGNFIRSTMPRVHYREENLCHDVVTDLKKGDVVIINSNIDHYQNELQIVLEDTKVEHQGYNLVAQIEQSDIEIIKYIQPWAKFKLEDK